MSEQKDKEYIQASKVFIHDPEGLRKFIEEKDMNEEALSGPALHRKIAEVMERRPDAWWVEFEWFSEARREWIVTADMGILFAGIEDGDKIRHCPPNVKLSGWVEPEVIKLADELKDIDYSSEQVTPREARQLAKALLSCVEGEK